MGERMQHVVGTVKEAFRLVDEARGLLARGPADYYLRQMSDYAELLFERFAPFRDGDRVELLKPPIISGPEHGWYYSRHFLVRGARGTVRGVDVCDKRFVCQVAFDDETWIDREGKPQPVTNKHTYAFYEDFLCLVERAPRG